MNDFIAGLLCKVFDRDRHDAKDKCQLHENHDNLTAFDRNAKACQISTRN